MAALATHRGRRRPTSLAKRGTVSGTTVLETGKNLDKHVLPVGHVRRLTCVWILLCCSSREESKDRHLSSPYHRRSYHLQQSDSQDAGGEQR